MKVCVLLLLSFFLVDAMDDRKKEILESGLEIFEELQDFHLKLCMLRWNMFNKEEMAICDNIRYHCQKIDNGLN